MTLPLVWMADALRAAGLTVVEYAGWQTRGQTDGPFRPVGLMWHHDASAVGPSAYVPAMMANLANNGAQCWVDTGGRWWLIAAGRMWHAGTGEGWGRILAGRGNELAVGIETDHTTGEEWPRAQLDSLRRGSRALLDRLGADPADALCGHKEYTTRKPDPDGLDMTAERRIVAAPREDDVYDQGDRNKMDALCTAVLGAWDPAATKAGTQPLAGSVAAGVDELVARPVAAAPAPLDLDYDKLAAALLRGIAGTTPPG